MSHQLHICGICCAGLKASLDEEQERRKAAEQRLQEVAVELQMEQSRSTDLHAQLVCFLPNLGSFPTSLDGKIEAGALTF